MSSAASRSAVVEVDDIPTLAQLYSSGEIDSRSDAERETPFAPDTKLNERISIWRGDITKIKADMIVNAANSSLLGGGGVDGAIHRAAGPDLYDECEELGGANTGETKITKGYELPAKYVAHTVGPIYSSSRVDQSAKLLESCYLTSLKHAEDHKVSSIAFSSISTGVYGYPIKDATRIALNTTRHFLSDNRQTIQRVVYVVFSKKDEEVYRSLVPEYFPPPA